MSQDHGPSSIGRRQITALADLIDLSNVSDRTDRTLNETATKRAAWVARRLDRTAERVGSRADGTLRRLKRARREADAALTKAAAGTRARFEGAVAKRRAQVEEKADKAEAGARGEYDHERWIADSVLEGRLNDAKARRQQETEALAVLRTEQAERDEHTREWARRYRRAEMEAVGEPDAAVEVEAVAAAARRVRRQPLAWPLVGVTPYLLGIGLAAAAGVGLAVTRPGPLVSWSPGAAAGLGLGVGAALAVGLGFLLRRVSSIYTRRALAHYEAMRRGYEAALDREDAAVVTRFDAAVTTAQGERDASHRQTEATFGPQFAKVRAFRSAGLAELAAAAGKQGTALTATQAEARAAFDRKWDGAIQKAEVRRDRRLDIATRRRDRDAGASAGALTAGATALQQRWDSGRDRVLASLEEIRQLEATSNQPWDDASWAQWSPPATAAAAVRFGTLHIDTRALLDDAASGGRFDLGLPPALEVPALLSGPDQRSLYVAAPPAARDAAMGLMRSVMMRLLTTLPPGRGHFTLIDPVGRGESFGAFMHLADHADQLVNGRVWSEPEHIDRRLTDLTDHMGQMIQKYLRNDYESIDHYNAQAGELAEPYRFLVVADYPHGFSTEAAARLNSIAASGARCGVFVLVAHDPREAPPTGEIEDLRRYCTRVGPDEGGRWRWQNPVCERFRFTPDLPPDEGLTTELIGKVGRAAIEAGRVQVPFATVTPSAEERWSRSASEFLDVPVGRAGATRLQGLRLGQGVAHHGVIAGRTGSGKSSLLHVLITNLCLWYPPDQLELYLIDFKKGVEFKPYVNQRPPHLRAVAVESDREFGLSILKRLDGVLDERGELFRAAGVANLAGYHRAEPERPMPRVVLMVDEFQEIFAQDDAIAASAALLLDRLVRQGRAFGMHVLLGSQSLSGGGGLSRGTLGQMSVRIALQCSESDSQLILGDDNGAARLLSRPGEAIYNDRGGELAANALFQVAWLPEPDLDAALRVIAELHAASVSDSGFAAAPCFVFEGNAPAQLRDDAPLRERCAADHWPEPPVAPRAALGEPIAIDAPTAVNFPRLNGANLLVLGQDTDAQLGLVSATLISLAAGHAPDAARFVVFNGSADPQHDAALRGVLDILPHGLVQVPARDVDAALAELHAELRRRMEQGASEAPVTFACVFGLQRFRQLRRSEDDFSFSMDESAASTVKPDRMLMDLLRDGPVVGLHLVVTCDRAASLEQVFDRRALREFDNRVLLQMSASDSAQLIDSSEAGDLGPCRALLFREDRGTVTRFRPYGLPNAEDLAALGRALRRPWRGEGAAPGVKATD